MDGKIRQLVGILGQIINVVEFFQNSLFIGIFKAIDRAASLENAVDGFHAVLKGGDHRWNRELDNQALAGLSLGVKGLVEQGGAQGDDVTAAHVEPDAVNQVSRLVVQKDAHFIELVEMLEFHINRVGTLVIVKKVIQIFPGASDLNLIFLRVDQSVVN